DADRGRAREDRRDPGRSRDVRYPLLDARAGRRLRDVAGRQARAELRGALRRVSVPQQGEGLRRARLRLAPRDPLRLRDVAPEADLRVEAERVARLTVRFASGGDEIAGALYAPAGDLPRPGVVIVHAVWVLSDHYHAVAQRLARAGFVALALDLYARGEKPGSPADMPGVMK